MKIIKRMMKEGIGKVTEENGKEREAEREETERKKNRK